MHTYYPPIKSYIDHQLPVDDPHVLYLEESGNPNGLPVLFVHGGPGAGCGADHRRFFDPDIYRIILFDQRGSGRSTPHAELYKNTTWDLVSDMERIREFLEIERWILFGGSWGSTLSLVYAQTHPERVQGLILRGIFLTHAHDMRWFFNDGANHIFPDYWADFVAHIPEPERHDLVGAYYRRLTGTDDLARMAAAKAWALWEAQCAALQPRSAVIDQLTNPHTAVSLARIECHYFVNQCFLKPNQILDNMAKIQHIPGIIVHGRYDAICTLDNAWHLHHAWPRSELHIVRDAGHAASEPGITDALIHATKKMASV